MTALLDSETVEALIEAGRQRGESSRAIADRIVALTEDPAWAKAMTHPVRGTILRLLREHGELSPTRAADMEKQPLGTFSYHFRQLAKLGLIEVSATIPRRGALEHVYRVAARTGAEE